MKTELDSLATALYVKTDDLLNDSPQLVPWRPAAGIAPQLSDAELRVRAAARRTGHPTAASGQPVLRSLLAYDH
jgi:hypothetical protein